MVISVFLMMLSVQVKAEIPRYSLDQDKHLVVDYLYRLIQQSEQHQLHEVITLENSEWQKIHLNNGDLLIMPGENWIAFELVNNTNKVKQVYLDMANQVRINEVELFIQDQYKNIDKKKMMLQRSNNRSVKVNADPHSQMTIYLAIKSSAQLRSSLKVYSTESYIAANSDLQFQQGIVIGGLLCLSIACMLLFFSTGSKAIIALFGYLLSNSLMLAAMLGFNLSYLFPAFTWLVGVELPLLSASSAICLLAFSTQFFHLKNKFYNIHRSIRAVCWALLIYMPVSIQLSIADNVNISMAIYILLELSLVILGIYLYKSASRLALLFTFVMLIQLIFVVIVIVSVNWFDMGFVSYRSSFYGMLFWLNALMITFILSYQYRYQLVDKHLAQRQALTSELNSERAQEELLTLQSQTQEDLENRVQERTLELNIALQELEEVNRELEKKNTLDELTGLYNRRFYDQRILAEYRRSKRNLTPLSIILIDIDHFKGVNDTYGHLAGDQCLAWVSKHINKSLKRSSDMAFRYGGEEFCLILPDTDAKGALALAETLRENIAERPFIYDEKSISLTVSNGLFTYVQQENITPEQIFSFADKALYQAKNHGRNQTQEYTTQ
ncbi:diguanylate cyclase [Colwellia sp. 4_MG-2023]|uniref:sensor domain-containing diguanylate cyclase n=1 Tax=unclassified Colwellia TaxID=196834 RepID=UPI001C0A4EE6|nr:MULTISPECIES: diguanylate cyclase [unclassified Colwellia]MBU2925598.1 diguanylate cyclase [Colwellia sp. C2M11]MDO6487763.1 diguanylate cyclase [Colwellia sp. 6_MG-2023]MDO6506890.1 diguanylate cyclase [Colwellia sp. 5_MG-2023]MDO6555735.1 diguanylate cyclase [Colwellia sp. 4_MG-2023]MDO6652776.1 diguanylate cyclase [Colwellia sp. 3_MG-2023]